MYLLTHSLVLVLVAVMKPKVLKTKISHADPPTLSLSLSLTHCRLYLCACCCDGIYGAQDLKISHAHSLILSVSAADRLLLLPEKKPVKESQ